MTLVREDRGGGTVRSTLVECPFCGADLLRPGTGGNGSPADHLRRCEAFQAFGETLGPRGDDVDDQ